MRLTWTAATALAASIGAPWSIAMAKDPPDARGGWMPEAEQSRVGVEMDYLHIVGKLLPENMVTADLTAQIGVTRHFFIDADIPAGMLASKGFVEGVFGNPVVGAHYAGRIDRRASGFVGVSVGLPLASASAPHFADQLAAYAIVVRAWRDPGHFLPHIVPMAARGGLEVDLAPVFLQFEVSPGLLADYRNGSALGYVDVTAVAGLRARFGLEGGLRAQGTFVIAEADDHAQTAIEPFIGYQTPERVGLYARYGLLVALDSPLGFGHGGYAVMTHRFSLGAKF